jgi:hypothetical protein
MFSVEKWLFSVTLRQGARFQALAIEIIKWVNKCAVAQAKVSHILGPGKASEKTPRSYSAKSVKYCRTPREKRVYDWVHLKVS